MRHLSGLRGDARRGSQALVRHIDGGAGVRDGVWPVQDAPDPLLAEDGSHAPHTVLVDLTRYIVKDDARQLREALKHD